MNEGLSILHFFRDGTHGPIGMDYLQHVKKDMGCVFAVVEKILRETFLPVFSL